MIQKKILASSLNVSESTLKRKITRNTVLMEELHRLGFKYPSTGWFFPANVANLIISHIEYTSREQIENK